MDERISCLRQALAEFEESEVHYALLRNYEFLQDETFLPESVDTVIREKDLPQVEEILFQQGFMKRKPQFSLKHHAYFKLVNMQLVSFDIQVGGVYWNDMAYLDESILRNRVKKSYLFSAKIASEGFVPLAIKLGALVAFPPNNDTSAPSELNKYKKSFFYTLAADDTFVMLVAHSILGKRFFKPKYQQLLASLQMIVDQENVIKQLSVIFNPKIARKLWIFIQQRQFAAVHPYRLAAYFLVKKWKHLTTFVPLFVRWVVWKKPLKLAPLVSFVGPDGAGKSLQVENLRQYLNEQKRQVAVVYTGRGREQFLPVFELARRYKWAERIRDQKKGEETMTKDTAEDTASQHIQNKNYTRRILYTLVSPLFAFDLYLRYLFRILPHRTKRNIVITDRYCTDIILMQHVPFWLRKWFYRMYPTPTISIFLYNTPEVLQQRRPKESVPELQRQLNLLGAFDYSLRLETKDLQKDKEKILTFVFSRLLQNWY